MFQSDLFRTLSSILIKTDVTMPEAIHLRPVSCIHVYVVVLHVHRYTHLADFTEYMCACVHTRNYALLAYTL
jgi:hypothetical protein